MRLPVLLPIAILSLGSTAGFSHETNAADFFPSGPQLLLAEGAAAGNTEQLESLVAAGADVNAKGQEGMTALLWAVSRVSKRGVAWLLQHGANPNVTLSRDGLSATALAAKLKDPWFLQEVLTHGGDKNIRNPISGRTPLVEAMASGRNDNVQTLIAAGADLNTVDSLGLTPLVAAAMNQKYELVYDMLIAGADPTTEFARGATLLSVVRRSRVLPGAPAYEWQLKVIELLKRRGLSVEDAP
jgi:hypothetical protein